MIPDEIIREIRERAVILEVISDYVVLKKSGVNYLGLCPFHSEKTPSFNVNTAKGIYHCFGCGVGGDAISFVMRMEGLSFPDAVKFLARKVGVVIPERAVPASEKRLRDERECLYEVHEIAAKFYEDLLRGGVPGAACRNYLEKRGVDEETSRLYGLGYAPDSWDALTRFLERKKFPLAEAEKVGLSALFRGSNRGVRRLLFPHLSSNIVFFYPQETGNFPQIQISFYRIRNLAKSWRQLLQHLHLPLDTADIFLTAKISEKELKNGYGSRNQTLKSIATVFFKITVRVFPGRHLNDTRRKIFLQENLH